MGLGGVIGDLLPLLLVIGVTILGKGIGGLSHE